MSHSRPMARHCRPQKHTHQIARMALRSAAPVNGGFGPERVRRVLSAAMATSSASTASKASDIGECIPRGRRSLGGVEGGAHMRLPPQSSIPLSTGRHAPSANSFLLYEADVLQNALDLLL